MTSVLTPPSIEFDTTVTALDPRLERLAARSAAARANRVTEPATTGHQPIAPTTRTRKRHAAKGSRTAALTMSTLSTLGLAGWFQHLDTANAETISTSSAQGSSATVSSAATGSTPASASSNATTASPATATASTAAPAGSTTKATTAVTSAAVATTSAETAAPTTSGLADGTYNGATFTNKWGPVQVQITVTNGTVTAVTALQTPDADQKSVQINNRALPTLKASTLTAQSATINSVSGATYTSVGYKQSLQSALDAAAATAA
jgi:uncharacterized protein with FMN-binding domain